MKLVNIITFRRTGRRLPSAAYVLALVTLSSIGIPGLLGLRHSPRRTASLVALKDAAGQQALVYLIHDLTTGRGVVCQQFPSNRDEALDSSGQGLHDADSLAAFARDLAAWRRQFCGVSDTAVREALNVIRARRSAILDQPHLIGPAMWNILTDARRSPHGAVDWSKADAVNLDGSVLSGLDLTHGHFHYSSFRGVQLVGTNIGAADFLGADFAGTLYSPGADGPGALPDLGGIASATNFDTIVSLDPAPLYTLRAALREKGYRDAERRLTYLIEDAVTVGVCASGAEGIQCALRRAFMQWPTHYGLYPFRALQVIIALIAVFSIVYLLALLNSTQPQVWRVWSKDRIEKHLGSETPEPISRSAHVPLWAIYFSTLSAFQIGWKELTIGSWIARVQPSEYSLQATGWVRTVSGVQSLVTFYLLVIWALTYFGRPFG